MIPLVAILQVRGRHSFRLWLPLFLVWLLLLPLVLVLLPFALVAMLIARINPIAAISASWDVLAALRGMHIEMAAAGNSILVHVY
jgi:hypothetical protein